MHTCKRDLVKISIPRYAHKKSKHMFINSYLTFLATTAERFFRIDKAQEHLHYITDISSEDLYILDPDMASTQHQHSIGNGEVAKASQEKGLVFTFSMPDTPPKSPGSVFFLWVIASMYFQNTSVISYNLSWFSAVLFIKKGNNSISNLFLDMKVELFPFTNSEIKIKYLPATYYRYFKILGLRIKR